MDDSSPTPPPPTRLPNPRYSGNLGFEYKFHDEVDNLARALERHRAALRTLETRSSDIPSPQDMQKYVERIENASSLRESIKELQQEHLDDLWELYAQHTAEYEADVNDFYASMDDSMYVEPHDTDSAVESSFEQLYNSHQSQVVASTSMSSEFSELRHVYLKRLSELRSNLRAAEEREASKFPRTAIEFNANSVEVKTRIAKYLLADDKTKEALRDEFNWVWRETEPLAQEFKSNLIFAATIKSLVPDQLLKP